MARVLVLYRKPGDEAHFSKYYRETHVPLASKIPGLRKWEVSKGPVVTPQGVSPFHFIATLTFDSMQALQQAMSSHEGAAAAADLANFADGGAEVLVFDDELVKS
jgi:uncharacterized protein (TIGR02118 family)